MMSRARMGGVIVALLLVTPGTGWTQIRPWQLYEREQEDRRQPTEPERSREEMKTQRQREKSRQVEERQPQRFEERQKDERLQERQP